MRSPWKYMTTDQKIRHSEQAKRWKDKNPDYQKNYAKKWRAANAEKIKEYQREYRKLNKTVCTQTN